MTKPGGLIVADKGRFSGEKPTGIDAARLGNASPMLGLGIKEPVSEEDGMPGCCNDHMSSFSAQAVEPS